MRLTLFVLFAVVFCPAAPVGFAQGDDEDAPIKVEADRAPIHSAIWLTAEGNWIRETLPIERLVGELRNLPFEEVIVQVVENGSAFYNSKQISKALGLTQNFDPLARILSDFHNGPRRKAVIAWIDPFRVGNVNSPLPVHLLTGAPERMNWLTRNDKDASQTASGDRYLDPGLPEVRALMKEVVAEVARYGVDGIYIDPIADPGPEWGYHPEMLKRFQTETNRADKPAPTDPAWIEFRVKVINETLTELVKAARAVKPGIMVAVGAEAVGKAPSSPEYFEQSAVYAERHQAWPQWLNDKLVSRVYLRNFHNEQQEGEQFVGWLNLTLAAVRDSKAIAYIGVGGSLNDSISALRQMQRVALSDAYGVALYSFQAPQRDLGVRDLFFDAVEETALSGSYVQRMRQLAENPRNPDRESTETIESELQLPPPPIEEGSSRNLIPIDRGEQDALAAARRLAGIDTTPEPTTTGTNLAPLNIVSAPTTTTLKKTDGKPRPNTPKTRREMLIDIINKSDFNQDRDTEPIRPSEKSHDYLKNKYQGIFEE